MSSEISQAIDPSVVAIIAAAIAAASGADAGSLRIASIQSAGFNTPVWGHVERMLGNRLPGTR